MSCGQRFDLIIKYLAEHNTLSVKKAMEITECSPATIRRDFTWLASKGFVIRFCGGIQLKVNDLEAAPPFDIRKFQKQNEKKILAAKACELIKNGDVIFVDGGTTTYQMASFLINKDIKIITNSIHLAHSILKQRESKNPEIYISGGKLYTDSEMLLGRGTIDSISKFHANWTFLSIGGLDEKGIYNHSELVSETALAMINNSDKVVVLADESKFGKRLWRYVCELDRIDVIITTTEVPELTMQQNKEKKNMPTLIKVSVAS